MIMSFEGTKEPLNLIIIKKYLCIVRLMIKKSLVAGEN